MSHMSPFRMNMPNMGDIPSSVANPKKRRKNVQNSMPTPPIVQDLLPPPLSGYGDTIVASNPFDDCPSSIGNAMRMVRNQPPVRTCHGMGSPMMHSPNGPHPGQMGPRMVGHMGGPGPMMGPGPPPHMMVSPNGPMHPMTRPPMHSPLGGMGGPMPGGPMGGNVPMGSPMGPMNGGDMGMGMGVPHMNNHGPPPGMPISAPNGPEPPPGMNNNNFMMNPMGNMYSKPMPVSAGKVYPADQPMVFNSQNPNAPPIYPCGVCHKEVHDNDQAILCESGCNFWFHRGCTGLTEGAFQMLTAEVYAEWACDKCLSTKNIPLVKFKP